MALNQKKLLYRPSLKCPHLGGSIKSTFLIWGHFNPWNGISLFWVKLWPKRAWDWVDLIYNPKIWVGNNFLHVFTSFEGVLTKIWGILLHCYHPTFISSKPVFDAVVFLSKCVAQKKHNIRKLTFLRAPKFINPSLTFLEEMMRSMALSS